MAETAIEWTDRTWNPVRGCTVVSPGCKNCYAMRQAARFDRPGGPYEGLTKPGPHGPLWSGAVRLVPEKLAEPLGWRRPCRVFVNSMSDLFHEAVPDGFITAVFGTMAAAAHHTFQVLTKRPARMRDWFARVYHGRPLPNVWLGVSVEDQARADERIGPLLSTPAAVRFVSAEPMLGPVDLRLTECDPGREKERHWLLHWVIAGGESGPGARACDVAWVRSLVRQCRAAGVACFVKQLGAYVVCRNDETADWFDDCAHLDMPGRPGYQGDVEGVRGFIDAKGGEPAEWPEDLRVREFPP